MSGRSDDDIERLANRVALLVSDTGEADNAGRAVGAMARRLGLSGGDLKAMFLAGATAGAASGASGPAIDRRAETAEVAALNRQLSALRHSLTLAEVAQRNAERERDALRRENETLQAALDRGNTHSQVLRIVGTTVIVALFFGGLYTTLSPTFRAPAGLLSAKPEPPGTPFVRTAIVRPTGARLYAAPNRGAAVIASLPPGSRLTVKRLETHVLAQWVEVDFTGRAGYVAATDVDMP